MPVGEIVAVGGLIAACVSASTSAGTLGLQVNKSIKESNPQVCLMVITSCYRSSDDPIARRR